MKIKVGDRVKVTRLMGVDKETSLSVGDTGTVIRGTGCNPDNPEISVFVVEFDDITYSKDCGNREEDGYQMFEDQLVKIQTQEELGEDLCEYCELEIQERGVRDYGNGPSFCSESPCCDRAYDNYIEAVEPEED